MLAQAGVAHKPGERTCLTLHANRVQFVVGFRVVSTMRRFSERFFGTPYRSLSTVMFATLFMLVLMFGVLPTDPSGNERAARLGTIVELLVSVTLVAVTTAYLFVTDRMARANDVQTETLARQFSLERTPNLLLTAEPTLGGSTVYRLANLGRHPVWVREVTSSAAYGRPLLRTQARYPTAQVGLLPGESVEVIVFPVETAKESNMTDDANIAVPSPPRESVVDVSFHYGATGPWTHKVQWRVELLPPTVAHDGSLVEHVAIIPNTPWPTPPEA